MNSMAMVAAVGFCLVSFANAEPLHAINPHAPGKAPATAKTPGAGTAVLQELSNIRDAENFLYIDSNRLTTIENLDDVLSGSATNYQNINDGGGALVIDPYYGLPTRQFLNSGTYFGPYLTAGSNHPYEGPSGAYDEGTPLDLFGTGQPYYLYSPLGLIEPKSGTVSLRFYGDAFFDYTLVSHGPDGIMSSDDVIVPIPGFNITHKVISSSRLKNNTAKSTNPYVLVIKGYNLGTSQGTGAVQLNGVDATGTVTLWSASRIEITFVIAPSLTAPVTVRTGAGQITNTLATSVDELASTAALHWDVYN
ncbi:hypothetical protein BH09SUM1_BH09SUM1_06650 [soil metagenome]